MIRKIIDEKQLIENYNKGLSTHKIAEIMGFSQGSISRKLINLGIHSTHPPGPSGTKHKFYIKCNNCGTPTKNKIFCSLKCQADKRFKDKISEWKLGRISGCDSYGRIHPFIRKYLIQNRGEKCELCGWDKRNPASDKVPLDIHHLDSNSDHSEYNLQLLCPNCHSLTPTYKSLNKGNGRHNRMIRYKNGQSF